MSRTFVGFGFGAIQAGLFVYEASRSGNFDRLVVSEVAPAIVEAVRMAGGRYSVNVATESGVEVRDVMGVEILNPLVSDDRKRLVNAVAEAEEIATALPSVKLYGSGGAGSVADILGEAFGARLDRHDGRRSIVYTAENDNLAAERLQAAVVERLGGAALSVTEQAQCLNTVIGKMSGVVTDEAQIREQRLARMAGESGRCLLVESFNRILISRVRWPDFRRGITVFEEKDDLLPFKEAKLYGHNATHALVGYMARKKGMATIADVRRDRDLCALARAAFLEESGAALCRRHRGVDRLFTENGYREYADDLLNRMMNPHLRDTVERVVRDPRRKLAWDDRLVGTMRMAMEQGITPRRYAAGARAAVDMIVETEGADRESVLEDIWLDSGAAESEKKAVRALILNSV